MGVRHNVLVRLVWTCRALLAELVRHVGEDAAMNVWWHFKFGVMEH